MAKSVDARAQFLRELKKRGETGAKSFCKCGHTGDGPKSSHLDTFQAGHGFCLRLGCPCQRFSWRSFIGQKQAV